MADIDPRNPEFPVPLARFLKSIKGTHDEVWSKLLQLDHGQKKMPPSEWHVLLEAVKAGKA